MRRLALVLVALAAACSVPDKQPLTDGGADGSQGGPLQTTITEAPAEFSNAATAMFRFEANIATAAFLCSVDGEPALPCTSPFSRSLADGPHNFSVRAIDAEGARDDTPAEHLWSIDTVAPITTLTEAPPAADNSETVRFAFIANEMNVVFECSLDNAAFTACRSGDMFGPIANGAHAFSVRAKDRAGNADPSPPVYAWALDTSTPDTQLIDGPDGSVRSQIATFTFISPDAGAGATFECSLDGAAFTTCVSPQTYENLDMGVHTFAVRVRDSVGNLDPTPATRTWLVDFTAPDTTLLSAPSGTISMASALFTFTASETEVTFECSLDSAAFATCTSPFNATDLEQGAHTFAVRATDAAGNQDSTPATASWTVDTLPPDLMITSGPSSDTTVGPRIVFTFMTDQGDLECRINGEAWMPCPSPFGFNAAAGAVTFDLRAIDAAGNVSTITRTFQVACTAPDPAGAAGLLHLDDGDQVLDNATGGAPAFLGLDETIEIVDPVPTTGRFGGGLSVSATEGDVVSWPLAGGDPMSFSIELWSSPSALSGTRDLLASGDGRTLLRVTSVGTNTVQFSATLVGASDVRYTVSSVAVTTDAWHHVLVSFEEPMMRLWVDGDRTDRDDARPGTAPTLDAFRLGGNYGGVVDEVWVSTTAITSDETALSRFCPTAGFTL